MNAVLDHDTPDLVVLNGDLTTGENLFYENSTDYIDTALLARFGFLARGRAK